MTRLLSILMLLFTVTACGGSEQQPAEETAPASTPASTPGAAPEAGALDIQLTAPAEPRMGENTFEVTVRQGGEPVNDANVSMQLFMEAMPSMNMPEMKSSVALTPQGEGRYRGTGPVSMSGAWDANIMVMRGDQHLGDRTITIVAK
jgi:nitrogen fixation protein FixH